MKWPAHLLLVRHAESAYNALKLRMNEDELYQDFKIAYQQNPLSDKVVEMAKQLHQLYPPQHSDMLTPLAVGGLEQAHQLGKQLRQMSSLPDVVYVSPYLRTWATLVGVLDEWPELSSVRVIEEERIREQEFGLRLLYSDWRFYFALNPEQSLLLSLQGSYWYRYVQGENIADVRDRNRSWMNTLTRDFAGQSILAITHHLNILAFRSNMDRLNAQAFLDLDADHQPANCSITEYIGRPELGRDGRFILIT